MKKVSYIKEREYKIKDFKYWYIDLGSHNYYKVYKIIDK